MERVWIRDDGAGMIAPFYAEAINSLLETQLVAVATACQKTAKNFVERSEVRFWHTDYRKLFSRDDIEIVSIYTSPFLHGKITIAAAKIGGEHIIAEKPISVTLKQADNMIDVCEKAGVTSFPPTRDGASGGNFRETGSHIAKER